MASNSGTLIRFASFFDYDGHIGEVISIALGQPKGWDYPEFEELMPPRSLLNDYRDGKGDVGGVR